MTLFALRGFLDRCFCSRTSRVLQTHLVKTKVPFIMQLLTIFFTSWIVIAVSGGELENPDIIPVGDASPDSALFNSGNLFDKPTESPSNPVLDDNDQWNSMTGLAPAFPFADNGGGLLFADSDDPNQMVVTDSSSLLAGDGGCDASNSDNTQLFAKVRRGGSCRTPPVGQTENPDQSRDTNLPNDAPYINPYSAILQQLLGRNPEICPINVFGLSNIPACKNVDEVEDFQQVAPNLFNIEYVSPRTSLHNLFLIT